MQRGMHMIQKGDLVRLKPTVVHTCPEGREDNDTATVAALLDVPGGVCTSRDLRGCKYWNVQDLVKIEGSAEIGK